MLLFVYAQNFVEHALSVPGLGKTNLMTQNGHLGGASVI